MRDDVLALRVARAILLTEPQVQHVLCVGVTRCLPVRAARFFTTSSATARVRLSSRAAPRPTGGSPIASSLAATTGILAPAVQRWWPRPYFPTAKVLIEQLLADAGFGPRDVDAVVATGVTPESWDILLGLVGIPADRVFRDRPSFGHTITADTFLYLEELRKRPDIPRGSRLLLFTFGFGSSFCGLLLEH